ncbi:MAG: DUF4286 family protein [Cyclobacteriaceae bacterium]|nr:DUF4286 family protein [Cytophagales bacterium]MBX2899479.1 DUF4286 family protein [Cyclobacteriaceae bacterium]
MLLYNVTFGIDKQIESEWLEWIKANYITKIKNTGLFTEFKIYKVLTHDEENSVSYSIQCFAPSIENVVLYLNEFAPAVVEVHRQQFKDQHVAFNTLLQEV